MPKIQGTRRTVQTTTARLTPPSTAGFGASGKAVQNVGKAISSFAGAFDAFAKVQEKNDKLDANMKLLDFYMDQDQQQFEARSAIKDDGRFHVDESLGRYDDAAGGLINSLPESQRERASVALKRNRFSIQNQAQRQQMGYQNEYWKGRGVEYSQNVVGKVITPESVKEGGLESAKAAIGIVDKAIDDMPISPSIKGAMRKTTAKAAAERVIATIEPKQYFEMLKQRQSVEKVAPKDGPWDGKDVKGGIVSAAKELGVDPVDLATAISYETAGTFNPAKRGPRTQWGRHRGLIQFGEPQARKYGVDWKNPVGSQLGPKGAIVKYLRDTGVKKGMGLLDIYSAINAGYVGRYNASDANNGGAPGTVRDKVQRQMSGHRKKAIALLGGKTFAAPDADPLTDVLFSPSAQKKMQKRHEEMVTAETTSRLQGKPSVVIETAVDGLRDQMEANPKHPDLPVAVEAAEKKLKEQRAALKNDPLKYADDEGLAEVPSLITQKDPVEAIGRRVDDAEQVATLYQIEPQYFRQEEKAFYARKFHETDVEGKLQMIAAFDKGAKGKAGKFLAELRDVDSSMAHIGGLYLAGRRDTAILAMQGLEVTKDRGLKAVTEGMKNSDVMAAYNAEFANTFGPDSIKQAGPFIATAKSIATGLMVQGKSPQEALEEGMRLATGYSEKNGEQYGGIAEFADQSFMIHPDHKASDVLSVFEHLVTRENYDAGANPNDARNSRRGVEINDKPLDFFLSVDGINPINPETHRSVTAEDMEDASFVSVGAGQYMVMINGVPLRDVRAAQSAGDGLIAYPKPYILNLRNNMERAMRVVRD